MKGQLRLVSFLLFLSAAARSSSNFGGFCSQDGGAPRFRNEVTPGRRKRASVERRGRKMTRQQQQQPEGLGAMENSSSSSGYSSSGYSSRRQHNYDTLPLYTTTN